MDGVNRLRKSQGFGTVMNLGLDNAYFELFQSGDARPGERQVVVFMSDGEPHDDIPNGPSNELIIGPDAVASALNLKSKGVEIFTIGIEGAKIKGTWLQQIASPDTPAVPQHYFSADSQNQMDKALLTIAGNVSGCQ
jgi:Mg-chelatase subunit ChlD